MPSLAPSQAPAQSQAAYSYGNQQMAPNPYAMWPQVRLTSAFNHAHPAHTWQPLRLSSEKKRKEVRRTRDHDSFPLVTVACYN